MFMWLVWWALSASAAEVAPAPSPVVRSAIATARTYIGTPWRWNGRGTERLPDIDCLGLLFRAYGKATGTPWTTYPVDPSKLVASGKLGRPVPGLRGVMRAELDQTKLLPGDVLYFLVEGYEIPDEPLLVMGERKFWPWHTGMYVGDGLVLNAHPSEGTKEMPLSAITWDALFVTRLGP